MKVEASVLGATTQNGAATRSGAERAPDEAKPEPKARVVVLRDATALEARARELDELGRSAIEPNPYFEPWMLLPALRAFPDERELELAVVERRDGAPIGLFPMVRERKVHGLPVPGLSIWRHEYCLLQTPLVHAASASECMDAFLAWLASRRDVALVELDGIAGDGPFAHALIDALNERREPYASVQRFTRGFSMLHADADAYLAAVFGGEGRRQLKSKERNLAREGQVTYEVLARGGDGARWIAEFIELENAGWKGKEGTAVASKPADRAFFEATMAEALRRGQLDMLALRLDGRPVAMKCTLRSGEGGFVFKIAYDERHARCSPGLLLEAESIRRMHAARDLRWLDSCASPRSPHFGRVSSHRRTIETLLLPAGAPGARLLISLLPLARWATQTVRDQAARRMKGRGSPPPEARAGVEA